MRKDSLKYTDFTAPGVEIHCLYGGNVSTVEQLDYRKSDDLDGSPTLINGDGDGTVNARSLKSCTKWQNTKKQLGKNIATLELPGVDHMNILSDNRIIKYVLDVLVGV